MIGCSSIKFLWCTDGVCDKRNQQRVHTQSMITRGGVSRELCIQMSLVTMYIRIISFTLCINA